MGEGKRLGDFFHHEASRDDDGQSPLTSRNNAFIPHDDIFLD